MIKTKKYEINVDGSEKIIFEFSDLAKKANGSVMVTQGQTKVLVTAVMGDEKQNLNFFPLRIDYVEKYYARGEILGGRYRKREGKPSDEAILTSRIIDRIVRPFFPENFRREVQIIATVLSLGKYDPDILAINGAILSLLVSDIPFEKIISAVRITKNEDENIFLNPKYEDYKNDENTFEAVVAGNDDDKIVMTEIQAKEVKEGECLDLITESLKETKNIISVFKDIRNDIGKEKDSYEIVNFSENLENLYEKEIKDELEKSFFEIGDFDKKIFNKFLKIIKDNNLQINEEELKNFLNYKQKNIFQNSVLNKNIRFGKRGLDEIRELKMQAGDFSEVVHGTGIFCRGSTHIMSFLTLGGLEDVLLQDEMEIQGEKFFMHHYNFPPYSVGEVERLRSPGRRELGHGKLVEKAIESVLPNQQSFPYVIRIVSETVSSNGSSSMASVCASSLALMDAGVPIKSHIAGVAFGLVYQSLDNYKILTDIKGSEDFYGHMDFKSAGTKNGITAIQLDLKIKGLPLEVLKQVFEKSKKARLKILNEMDKRISQPNELPENLDLSKMIKINSSKIGLIIGKKGQKIKEIIRETDTKIEIEDNGDILIKGEKEAIEKAIKIIKEIIKSSYFKK